MKYVVLVKGVPDFRHGHVKFKEDNTLDRGQTPTVLNPNDHLALHGALEAKVKHGGEVHLVSMGPPNYKKIIAEAMGIYGDKGALCSDIKLGGADTLATAYTLSAAIKKIGDIDIVFAGFKSADGETGQTGPQTAWKLGWPVVTHVTRLEIDEQARTFKAERFVYDEIEEVTGPLPCVIITDPGFRPVYTKASHRLKLRELQEETRERARSISEGLAAAKDAAGAKTIIDSIPTWTQADLQVDENLVGLRGSPTIVRVVEPIPAAPSERKALVLDGKKPQDIDEAAKIIVQKMGGA